MQWANGALDGRHMGAVRLWRCMAGSRPRARESCEIVATAHISHLGGPQMGEGGVRVREEACKMQETGGEGYLGGAAL